MLEAQLEYERKQNQLNQAWLDPGPLYSQNQPYTSPVNPQVRSGQHDPRNFGHSDAKFMQSVNAMLQGV